MNDQALLSDSNDMASSNKSLTTLAYDHIRSDILTGVLKPQDRLRITSLAERYNVGATAVREALSRLVTGGLVESEDQRGFSVAPVSRAELLDLTQTRIDVESLALTKAIELGDIDWESSVISAFHRLSKTQPSSIADETAMEAWGQAHRQFHACLLEGCKSPWLLRLTGLLYDRSERYRNLSVRHAATGKHNAVAEERGRDVQNEHRALMEATIARDAAKATQLLSDHFWATTNIILRSDIVGEQTKTRVRRAST